MYPKNFFFCTDTAPRAQHVFSVFLFCMGCGSSSVAPRNTEPNTKPTQVTYMRVCCLCVLKTRTIHNCYALKFIMLHVKGYQCDVLDGKLNKLVSNDCKLIGLYHSASNCDDSYLGKNHENTNRGRLFFCFLHCRCFGVCLCRCRCLYLCPSMSLYPLSRSLILLSPTCFILPLILTAVATAFYCQTVSISKTHAT